MIQQEALRNAVIESVGVILRKFTPELTVDDAKSIIAAEMLSPEFKDQILMAAVAFKTVKAHVQRKVEGGAG